MAIELPAVSKFDHLVNAEKISQALLLPVSLMLKMLVFLTGMLTKPVPADSAKSAGKVEHKLVETFSWCSTIS